jgi:hypothetical protein
LTVSTAAIVSRILLLLAHVGKDANFEHFIPRINQDTPAENDRHDAAKDQVLHEQIQKASLCSPQRWLGRP